MKRRIFFKTTVLCLAMIAGSIFLTACDDDENEPEVTNAVTTIKTEFSVSLSENWYKFFDIEVTYTSETGEKTITLTQDWNFNMKIPYSAEPDKFVCNIIAKPKADVPAIEADATYLLKEEIHAAVYGILKDGTEDLGYGSMGNRISSQTMVGKNMSKYIKSERRLLSFSFIPDKK